MPYLIQGPAQCTLCRYRKSDELEYRIRVAGHEGNRIFLRLDAQMNDDEDYSEVKRLDKKVINGHRRQEGKEEIC